MTPFKILKRLVGVMALLLATLLIFGIILPVTLVLLGLRWVITGKFSEETLDTVLEFFDPLLERLMP